MTRDEYIAREDRYGAHNYKPLPVVLERGEGARVWDTDGKEYFDFLAAYSAVNQGHCHPKIIKALAEQGQKLTLTSRAFHSNNLGEFEQYMSELFGFDKVLVMNSGVEAVETGLKLCRKWAYKVKGIRENEAKIIVVDGNFHGRTTGVISFSTDPDSYAGFGPFMPGYITIPYNDLEALEEALNIPGVAGFMLEPIQGEAGVIVPDEGYLSKANAMCKAKNVLFIADEVQTGIARTGRLLATCGNCSCPEKNCSGTPDVKPDILILGKAVSGGVYPVSAVLADDDIMSVIKPGQHGSTFGGNPLAMSAGNAVMDVMFKKGFLSNVTKNGKYFLKELNKLKEKYPKIIKEVRGKGLLVGLCLHKDQTNFIKKLLENNLLSVRAAENVVRLLPPLNVTKAEINLGLKIIDKVCKNYR